MNESTWIQFTRLAWKDERLIRSLGIAIVIGIVGFNLLAYPVARFGTDEPAANVFASFTIWFIMPFLFAFGAGAMLIGSEEESGTLAWMRSLPISWKTNVASKLAVAVGWLLAIWIVATVMLGLQYAVADGLPDRMTNDSNFKASHLVAGWCVYFFFSLVVLLTGFLTSFVFRSPVAALVVLFAPLAFLIWLVAFLTNEVLRGTGESWLAIVAVNLTVLAALLAITVLAARRRLCKPSSTSRFKGLLPSSDSHRPAVNVRLDRPSVNSALLWQQFRQTLPIALPCTLIIYSIALVVSLLGGPSVGSWSLVAFLPLSITSTVLSYTFIGAMTFYGDSVRRRCVFFADRGIAPTTVWWTRVVVSAGYFLLVLAPLLVVLAKQSLNDWSAYDLTTAAFCLPAGWSVAVFVSMLMRRAILSFFATLVVLSMLPAAFSWFFYQYDGYVWTVIAITPVMLFASWRLCGRWLEGKMNFGFYWRAAAYLALAIAVPMLITLCHYHLGRLVT